jgi:hypothetical protein
VPGMTCDAWAELDLLPGNGPPPAAEPTQAPGHGGDARVLGQEISHRLFSAGLDLDFALSLDGDGPAADRLRHAVAELDEAIKDLRHLMLGVPGPAAGAVPDGLSDDEGSGPR